MDESTFLSQVKRIWESIATRPGHGGYAYFDFFYYPSEHRGINLNMWGLTKEDLVGFAEEVLKLEGYRIRKEALTPSVLRRELQTYIDAQKSKQSR